MTIPPIEVLQARLLNEDAEFRAWVDSLPDSYWAKYDLSAMRLGWEAARAGRKLTVYDWAYTGEVTGRHIYAKTPERAAELIRAGVKVTPVYTIHEE